MIPGVIQRKHVIGAMDEIDRAGIPHGREPRKFFVSRKEKRYPPKYVISVAFRIATGKELAPTAFNGGAETNKALQRLGFSIGQYETAVPEKRLDTRPRSSEVAVYPSAHSAPHNERCPECKQRLETLLSKLYGRVVRNAKVPIPATPTHLEPSPVRNILDKIYTALQESRGFRSFVRRDTLSRCDFFVPNPGFIVEFDESQHFTQQRKLALSFYPADLHFGFDLTSWMQRCDDLQKHDNDPPFRDEQRAWYDTLRDFAPFIENLLPTLRLYVGESEWCKAFNPEQAEDVDRFRRLLGERANFWRLEFHCPAKPTLARIVVDGPWSGSQVVARKLLGDICEQWPCGLHTKCLSTPGAFLRFDWPKVIRPQRDNRFPKQGALGQLDAEARPHVELLLDHGMRQRLAEHSDHLSIGIDTDKEKISSTNNYIPEQHAELVYVVDLQNGEMHFTGKSYPTCNQEKRLLRVSDLNSHFISLGGEKTMVLGCHDLTMFNPRAKAKALGWRLKTLREFKKLARHNAPTLVLHHPHTTVKQKTWLNAWNELRRELPMVRSYVGTGCYSFRDENRDSLNDVLEATKSPDAVDIVVSMARP